MLLVVSAVWIEAQGIHLAANAIGDVFDAGPPRDAFYATNAGGLDHFLDEDLSHWAWHAAWVALTAVIVWSAWTPSSIGVSADPPAAATTAPTVAAGLLHGVTFFFVTAEGGTAALGIPASIAFAAVTARRIRAGSRNPALAFVLIASLVTLGLDLGWAALHGGQLVEPCSVLGC